MNTPEDEAALAARFERLTSEGHLLERRGELDKALAAFAESQSIAGLLTSQDMSFRAACNISTVKLLRGDVADAEKGLREILLRAQSPRVIFVASYNLASALRRQGNLAKSLFYAKKAMETTGVLDDPRSTASCCNLLGNIYRDMSYPDDASREYERGLQLAQRAGISTSFEVDYVRENLGYCLLLKKKFRQGIAIILEALQIAQGNDNARCIAECCQDVCFGYMQLKELERAVEYGDRALAMATERGYGDIVKNCYYLLGEIHLLRGDDEKSDHYFGKLQELYPQLGVLREFLRTFDVSNVINLKTTF